MRAADVKSCSMPPKDVDADDQDDATRTEQVIALALIAAFATSQTPGALSNIENVMRSAIGLVLQFYVVRMLVAFLTSFTAHRDPAMWDLEEVANNAVDHAIVEAANASQQLLGARSDAHTTEDDEMGYRRLRAGLGQIARIAVTQAREEAKKDFALGMGATGRVWRTKKDNRVRVSHYDLEGEFKRVGVPFVTINNVELDRPGDPSAPLNERLGCRCRLSWRVPT